MRQLSFALICVSGLLQAGTGWAASKTVYNYDSMGRLAATAQGLGQVSDTVTEYRYDKSGNRTSVIVSQVDNFKVPVFRFNGGTQHFYSISYLEGTQAGLNSDGVGFNLIFSSAGSHLLYRCLLNGNGDHFISADSNCEGATVEGALGYAYNVQSAGFIPLYRFRKSSSADHLITVNYNEGISNGYIYEGVLGYVP